MRRLLAALLVVSICACSLVLGFDHGSLRTEPGPDAIARIGPDCGVRCTDGFKDCNGDPSDGC